MEILIPKNEADKNVINELLKIVNQLEPNVQTVFNAFIKQNEAERKVTISDDKILEVVANSKEIPQNIVDFVEKQMPKNSVETNAIESKEYEDAFCKIIATSKSKSDVVNSLRNLAIEHKLFDGKVKNEFSGLVLPAKIDSTIAHAWQDNAGFFSYLDNTALNTFHVLKKDIEDVSVMPKIAPVDFNEKSASDIIVESIRLDEEFAYIMQRLTSKQILDLENSGLLNTVIAQLFALMTIQLQAMLVKAIVLTGATRNNNMFIKPMFGATTDTFRTVTSGAISITPLRTASDSIILRPGQRKVCVINPNRLSVLMANTAPGAALPYMSEEDFKAQINVDEIYKLSTMPQDSIVIFATGSYAWKTKGIKNYSAFLFWLNAEYMMCEIASAGDVKQPRSVACVENTTIVATVTNNNTLTLTGTGAALVVNGDYNVINGQNNQNVKFTTKVATVSGIENGTYRASVTFTGFGDPILTIY